MHFTLEAQPQCPTAQCLKTDVCLPRVSCGETAPHLIPVAGQKLPMACCTALSWLPRSGLYSSAAAFVYHDRMQSLCAIAFRLGHRVSYWPRDARHQLHG